MPLEPRGEEFVNQLHDELIKLFGGTFDLRDVNLLRAALTRPFGGLANGTKFFPAIIEQSASLLEAMIKYHPFVDGNKRTATITTLFYLEDNGYSLIYSDEEIIEFVVNIAS
jgi:death-on-curing protein